LQFKLVSTVTAIRVQISAVHYRWASVLHFTPLAPWPADIRWVHSWGAGKWSTQWTRPIKNPVQAQPVQRHHHGHHGHHGHHRHHGPGSSDGRGLQTERPRVRLGHTIETCQCIKQIINGFYFWPTVRALHG